MAATPGTGGSHIGGRPPYITSSAAQKIARNKQLLADLFGGPFPGHAIVMDPSEGTEAPGPGDFTCSEKPLTDWVDWHVKLYEIRLKHLERIDDDTVPIVKTATGTGVFAAAFGCELYLYPDSPAAARPLVRTAEEADALPDATLEAPSIQKLFDFYFMVRDIVGPDVPISVPDIQSPFDVAALVWNKQDMFVAMHDDPEAVKRHVGRCHRLLKAFFRAFLDLPGERCFCHYPYCWAPPGFGVWLSEDDAGSFSAEMFDEFCLPWLADLSETFGGLVMHCCADADHQYDSFRKIPNLRGLNRVFQSPGPRPAIEAFSGRTVFVQPVSGEQQVYDFLDMALPDTRFYFNVGGVPADEQKAAYERLRARCPRIDRTGT